MGWRRVLRMVAILLVACIVLVMALVCMPRTWLHELTRHLFLLESPKVYGTLDPSARVYVFNHPTNVDVFVLANAVGDLMGLVRDKWCLYKPVLDVLATAWGCVMVRKEGGQDTTERVRRKLRASKKPFAISTNTLDKGQRLSLAGVVAGYPMPERFSTMPFRLGERVQPLVIIYEGLDIVPRRFPSIVAYWLCQKRRVQPHVVMLPAIDPDAFDSAEECMLYVRDQMARALTSHWPSPRPSPRPSATSSSNPMNST
jgi:hypothetical protein